MCINGNEIPSNVDIRILLSQTFSCGHYTSIVKHNLTSNKIAVSVKVRPYLLNSKQHPWQSGLSASLLGVGKVRSSYFRRIPFTILRRSSLVCELQQDSGGKKLD